MHDAQYYLAEKRYRLCFVNLRGKTKGYCDPPSKPNRRMLIKERKQPSRRVLDDIIHECLHACAWDMSEEWVYQTANDLARVLWDQGFRNSNDE